LLQAELLKRLVERPQALLNGLADPHQHSTRAGPLFADGDFKEGSNDAPSILGDIMHI
jgi:hypothetical protein